VRLPKPEEPEIPISNNNKSQACPRMFWSGTNLKLQITMNKTKQTTLKIFILFEISEIGHWILFVIRLLQFVISSLAKKQQDVTTQVLR